jgi:transcriptional regulator with XRE-family HTH domain
MARRHKNDVSSTIGDGGAQGVDCFGRAVGEARARSGLSLSDLAAASGVSRAMLSKVERGERQPTLPVAGRIAQGLGLTLSQLLGARASCGAFVVARGAGRLAFRDGSSGFLRELLSPPVAGSGLELVRHSIAEGGSSGELPPYPQGTRKLVLVQEGRLMLRVGACYAELEADDSAHFEAEVPHSFANGGEGTCTYLLVIDHGTD